jgi:exosome complex RNA-binding protein Csl4
MGWASQWIIKLQNNETVQFRPRGNSMSGKIESGNLCTVEPIKDFLNLKKGDIVLCKVNGNQYLHLITAIDKERFQISNNHNFINGWIHKNNIYGKLIKVEK